MSITTTVFKKYSIITLAGIMALSSAATGKEDATKLLTAHFEIRNVVQIEVGDFHFTPGQAAPIHTHTAPAVGYVVKGEIIYQVEGERVQILREGDAFFEPTGPRILRFDNASATEEAVFVDFNLEQVDEPFIVFEKPPSEAIDRRSLQTIQLESRKLEKVNVYTRELGANVSVLISAAEPILGLVAEGIITLKVNGKNLRIVAGKSFYLPQSGNQASIKNESADVAAKIVTFHLR